MQLIIKSEDELISRCMSASRPVLHHNSRIQTPHPIANLISSVCTFCRVAARICTKWYPFANLVRNIHLNTYLSSRRILFCSTITLLDNGMILRHINITFLILRNCILRCTCCRVAARICTKWSVNFSTADWDRRGPHLLKPKHVKQWKKDQQSQFVLQTFNSIPKL